MREWLVYDTCRPGPTIFDRSCPCIARHRVLKKARQACLVARPSFAHAVQSNSKFPNGRTAKQWCIRPSIVQAAVAETAMAAPQSQTQACIAAVHPAVGLQAAGRPRGHKGRRMVLSVRMPGTHSLLASLTVAWGCKLKTAQHEACAQCHHNRGASCCSRASRRCRPAG